MLVVKRGPGSGLRMPKYLMIYLTGQTTLSVLPRKMWRPCRNGSVLLCLMAICITEGLLWLSRARSPRFRWTSGSYVAGEGTVNSPARRKPKKPVQAAAQSMVPSSCGSSPTHIRWRCCIISSVIGSRLRGATPVRDSTRFTPVSTYSRRGIAPSANGLPMPCCIWRHLIADKYALIVRYFRCCWAKKAT